MYGDRTRTRDIWRKDKDEIIRKGLRIENI